MVFILSRHSCSIRGRYVLKNEQLTVDFSSRSCLHVYIIPIQT